MQQRKIALIRHYHRPDIEDSILAFKTRIEAANFSVIDGDNQTDYTGVELIVVFGGDGTILQAAEFARGYQVPILGINYGHVGFLAEVDRDSLEVVVEAIVNRSWTVDERMTIDVTVRKPDTSEESGWALNEVSVEKDPPARMIETDLAVDGRGVSSFKCDGVLLSTPTGSTGYNYSAGGPIVWPNVEALVMIPIAAHALFTRPLVTSPESTLEVQIRADDALVTCDGRRVISAPPGSVVTARRGKKPVLLARLNDAPFSARLVAKFKLPVEGWRNSD
ncbi:MAG: NAD kinase [Arcanobacterium sp.]|nr:NAD kinase [Arcanobacterium sp.]